MIVKSQFNHSAQHLTLRISGEFRFNDHTAFIAAYSKTDVRPARVTLDLSQTTAVDSAALGMMLLLADHVGGPTHVEIFGAHGAVERVMQIARLDRLFSLGEDPYGLVG